MLKGNFDVSDTTPQVPEIIKSRKFKTDEEKIRIILDYYFNRKLYSKTRKKPVRSKKIVR